VSMTTNPREGKSSDAVLAELTQALEEIGRGAPPLVRPNEEIFEQEDAAGQSKRQMLAAILGRLPRPGALPLWSLVVGLAVGFIGIIVFAWPSPDARAPRPTISSSVSAAKTDTGLQPPSIQAQTAPQRAGPAAPSTSPELTQWGQTIARELASLTQGVEQLKTSQAQLARDNAELAGHLKETLEEMVRRHDAELAKDLRAAQEEMTRDNLSFAAQLKASQEQISGIGEQLKATQEQLNRVAAPKQLRPAKLASPSPPQPNATPTPKPAPKPPSPQAGRLPKNSTQSQPEQP
jgi:gas vesicle protein